MTDVIIFDGGENKYAKKPLSTTSASKYPTNTAIEF